MKKNILPNYNLFTSWGENLDRESVHQEYPRPHFRRNSYFNLNGQWDYAVSAGRYDSFPAAEGQILVPFSPESALSGVKDFLKPGEFLYYRRYFTLPEKFNKGNVILNFGAVDQCCDVFVNGLLAGGNKGGYYSFSINISKYLNPKNEYGEEQANEITVRVTDDSDKGVWGYGKQKIKHGGIWYTPQSGIWQTVWLESVPYNYLPSVKIDTDIRKKEAVFKINLAGAHRRIAVRVFEPVLWNKDEGKDLTDVFTSDPYLEMTEFNNQNLEYFFNDDFGKSLASTSYGDVLKEAKDSTVTVEFSSIKLWSPEEPYLYRYILSSGEDAVCGYFAFRRVNIAKDKQGVLRPFLNGEPVVFHGVLDQGYWPEGLYTPPSEEAVTYELNKLKTCGFNTVRKHIKVEPMRWYYNCDRLGLMVWQDFVSGGGKYKKSTVAVKPFLGNRLDDGNYRIFGRDNAISRKNFRNEALRTVRQLINVPSVVAWVPFNEGWGQFDAAEMYNTVKKYDPTRLIDHASGWHDQFAGDFDSRHVYFKKVSYDGDPAAKGKDPLPARPFALTEFGGYSLKIAGHVADENKSFGYKSMKNFEQLAKDFEELYKSQVVPLIDKGLSVAFYTQVSDVEDETNGLFTADRRVFKIDPNILVRISEKMRVKN